MPDVVCEVCGAGGPPGASFCPSCGARFATPAPSRSSEAARGPNPWLQLDEPADGDAAPGAARPELPGGDAPWSDGDDPVPVTRIVQPGDDDGDRDRDVGAVPVTRVIWSDEGVADPVPVTRVVRSDDAVADPVPVPVTRVERSEERGPVAAESEPGDPHGFTAVVARLGPESYRSALAALPMAAVTLARDERVEALVQGRIEGVAGVAVLTRTRALLVTPRLWVPLCASLPLALGLAVRAEPGGGSLFVEQATERYEVDQIIDAGLAADFAARAAALLAAFGRG